jgi:Tfp pilus assembly protein PilX
MILFHGKESKTSERGIALIVALMLLLLISAALMGMIMMSNTETNVSANFRDEQTAFFASKAGIEEVRDRMRSPATNSLKSNLPAALPGATNGVLYVTNPAPGETVTPWLPLGSNYPDTEICKEVTCASGVPTGSWYATPQSASTSYTAAPILPWKWVRVTAKANQSVTGTAPVTSVDGQTNGNRVCWTGSNEVVTAAASCSANTPPYSPV